MLTRITLIAATLFATTAVTSSAASPPGDGASAPAFGAVVPPPAGVTYTPPPCVGLFPDVPCSHQFARWIEQLYRDRITTGCGAGNYCPDAYVTRGQMAAFLERMVRGTERWPPNVVYVWQVLNDDGSPDPFASGQALRDAIAAIPASGPLTPTPSNPTLVKIGPGTYRLDGQVLYVPDSVVLEGAGRSLTTLSSKHSNDHPVVASSGIQLELSDLSLVRHGTGEHAAWALCILDARYATLRNVAIEALSGYPDSYAVFLTGGSLYAVDCSFDARIGSGGGLKAYAVYAMGDDEWDRVFVSTSWLSGSTAAARNAGDGYFQLLFNRLRGGMAGPRVQCFQNVDTDTLAPACP